MKKNEYTKEMLDSVQTELTDWKNKYIRALADYQNLEKRVVNQKAELIQYASKQFALKILPVLDIFEKAQNHIQDEGLALGLKQFYIALKDELIEKMQVVGKDFDPLTMECVELVTSDKEDKVIEEIQPGYLINGIVLRVAKVKVGKKMELKEENIKN
jgi:molecular chaperone GrpE